MTRQELMFKTVFTEVSYSIWNKTQEYKHKKMWLKNLSESASYNGGTDLKNTASFIVGVYVDTTSEN